MIDGVIAVDLGLRKGDVGEDAVSGLNALLFTHGHGDHMLGATVRWLDSMRPDLLSRQTYMGMGAYDALCDRCPELAAKVDPGHVVGDGEPFELATSKGTYAVTPVAVEHGDEECLAYEIISPSGGRLIWATDLESAEPLPAGPYDCICLEGSYDDALLDAALDDPDLAERAACNLRHLPNSEFEAFVRENAGTGCVAHQLHVSRDFGRRSAAAAPASAAYAA